MLMAVFYFFVGCSFCVHCCWESMEYIMLRCRKQFQAVGIYQGVTCQGTASFISKALFTILFKQIIFTSRRNSYIPAYSCICFWLMTHVLNFMTPPPVEPMLKMPVIRGEKAPKVAPRRVNFPSNVETSANVCRLGTRVTKLIEKNNS